jgi:uncharacterized protein YdiU (UPF0061 family)
MKAYLDPSRKTAALAQVKRYVERNRGTFQNILAAEYDVSIPTETFILQGVIDLLRGEGETLYADWFADVCERTARLAAEWMRVGFVHGVLNTDNMSILGLTIDYGPYGWIDDYDPDWTPNTTDAMGRRYRFGWQPKVAYWNLGQLARALSALFGDVQPLQSGLNATPPCTPGPNTPRTRASSASPSGATLTTPRCSGTCTT